MTSIPSPSPAVSSRSDPSDGKSSRIWGMTVAGLLGLVAFVAIFQWQSRLQIIAEAENNMIASVKSGAVLIDTIVEDMNSTYRDFQNDFARSGQSLPAFARDNEIMLENTVQRQPVRMSYFTADNDGNIIISSVVSAVGQNFADRRYFIVQRDGIADGMFVSDPIVSRVSNARIYVFSWPLYDVNGAFAGIMGALVQNQDLERVLRESLVGPHKNLVLSKLDGTILSSTVAGGSQALAIDHREVAISRSVAQTAGADTIPSTERISGPLLKRSGDWILISGRLSAFDAAVTAIVDQDALLAPWQETTMLMAVLVGIAGLYGLGFAVIVNRCFRERDRVIRSVQYEATTDPLTGLPNRRAFNDRAAMEWARSRRTGHPATLAIFDLDHFKTINDTYGHDVGDQILCLVSRVFQDAIRREDVIARLGGEEFVAILPNTDREKAMTVLERIREMVAYQRVTYRGHEVGVTVSIGACHIAPGSDPVPAALRRADSAVYEAKDQGRNRVVWSKDEAKVIPLALRKSPAVDLDTA